MPPNGSRGSETTMALTKQPAGFDLVDEATAARDGSWSKRCAEAERRVVGEPDGGVVVRATE